MNECMCMCVYVCVCVCVWCVRMMCRVELCCKNVVEACFCLFVVREHEWYYQRRTVLIK